MAKTIKATEMDAEVRRKLIKDSFYNFGTCTAKELCTYICRKTNIIVTPSQAAGVIRSLKEKGLVGSSNCGSGETHYWPIREEWNSND